MRRIAAIVLALAATACAAPVPEGLGVRDGRLAPCPESPNCVSSDARDSTHRTDPLRYEGDPAAAWAAARRAVEALPRTVVAESSDDYLRAETTTPLMRYVDDLELHLRADRGEIAVRSAARVGWSDMGTNRERVWELRRAFGSQRVTD